MLAHESADPDVLATALLRGAFEYQGQKCSAASRAYIPANLAAAVKQKLIDGVKSFKMGTVEDFSNFINAVIDERSFNKIKSYLDKAQAGPRRRDLGRRRMRQVKRLLRTADGDRS